MYLSKVDSPTQKKNGLRAFVNCLRSTRHSGPEASTQGAIIKSKSFVVPMRKRGASVQGPSTGSDRSGPVG